MNPFKNISIFRDQDTSSCNLKPWSSSPTDDSSCTETTKFPEKEEYSKLGNLDYSKSQLNEILLLEKKLELLQQENDRLQHLTTVLIDHIWKKHPFPLKEIDQQMLEYDKEQSQFDDGGIDGTPRNV